MSSSAASSNPAAGAPHQSPTGARLALLVLVLINLFNYIDRQVLAAVVPSIKAEFFNDEGGLQGQNRGDASLTALMDWCQEHLGFKPEDALIGVLSTAFMVMYMIGAPLFGKLAERHSRWALVAVGVVLWSLASGASGLAASFGLLLLTRCFVGVGEAAYGPVAPTLISDYFPVKIRGRVLAWFYMAIPVGSALGYVLGDLVAKSSIGDWGGGLLGMKTESWRWAFFLVVPPGLALGLWCLWMREPARGQVDAAHVEPEHRVHWRDYLILLRTPSYVLCTLGMTAMTFAIGGISFWMPYYLEQNPGVTVSNPTTVFGAVVVISGLTATLAGGMAGDRLRRRFGGAYFLVSGAAMLIGFPLFLLALSSTGIWIWVFIFLACFCLFFNTGPTNTILANVTHPSIRAAGFALNIFVIHALGDVISPVIIGILSDKYSLTTGFLVVGGMFLVSGAFWLCGARFLARDTELATTRLASG